jgi:hypothetical protein
MGGVRGTSRQAGTATPLAGYFEIERQIKLRRRLVCLFGGLAPYGWDFALQNPPTPYGRHYPGVAGAPGGRLVALAKAAGAFVACWFTQFLAASLHAIGGLTGKALSPQCHLIRLGILQPGRKRRCGFVTQAVLQYQMHGEVIDACKPDQGIAFFAGGHARIIIRSPPATHTEKPGIRCA